mgnify:CR=1 FL=1
MITVIYVSYRDVWLTRFTTVLAKLHSTIIPCNIFVSACICSYTVTIRLSACPLNCIALLSAFSIGVKIQFKKIAFFYEKIISNKVGTMFQNFKNKKIINKNRNYVPNIISSSPFIRNAKALGKNPSQISVI